jgi:hypothetical protein
VNAREIVSELDLLPHPEGGYFKETYRSSGAIPKESLEEFNGPRSFGTGIYYLLEQGQFSALHRIKSDEIWHHYHGGVLEIIELSLEAGIKKTLLGSDLKQGQVFQHVVPAGVWFGARPVQGDFVLVGCTVAPGFDFADFEMAKGKDLVESFPQYESLILEMTR